MAQMNFPHETMLDILEILTGIEVLSIDFNKDDALQFIASKPSPAKVYDYCKEVSDGTEDTFIKNVLYVDIYKRPSSSAG